MMSFERWFLYFHPRQFFYLPLYRIVVDYSDHEAPVTTTSPAKDGITWQIKRNGRLQDRSYILKSYRCSVLVTGCRATSLSICNPTAFDNSTNGLDMQNVALHPLEWSNKAQTWSGIRFWVSNQDVACKFRRCQGSVGGEQQVALPPT